MFTDLDETALWEYRSTAEEPDDFDAFWLRTLTESAGHQLDLTLSPVDCGLQSVAVWDVSFGGFGGHPIAGRRLWAKASIVSRSNRSVAYSK